MKTLIMGLGNPILTDDAAGLHAARRLYEILRDNDIDLVEAAVAGVRAVPMLLGYDRVVVVDVLYDETRVGEVSRLEPKDLPKSTSPLSHGVGLNQALQQAQTYGWDVPQEIVIYAIAVKDPYTFGEEMTPEVEKALPNAVQQMADDLAQRWALTRCRDV